ncbi:NnrU family protein [Halopseudomonas nanhaiensis]|uniref:NnrU family protein n=1 Tax=Halopseudomonas nanhaiensis TaxID=2830842 RepID=UPI001CC1ADF6|nr:NnrU family protein [Halopseudomonas nanhaiensis]UAW98200.1 NnrU family protein [Halopseudomonas nanhaiensis]
MLALIAGLVVFLGVHSVGLFAAGWRAQMIARLGPLAWKGLYALVAVVGLVLIVHGYGQARLSPTWLWVPPVWTRHLAALLTLPAFILLVATYLPGSHIKARVGHPMLLGVKFWAIAHLIANGTVADLLLFGSFLIWAVALFVVLRRRDRIAGVVRSGRASRDVAVVVVGLVAWVAFALWLHKLLIGVAPFGGA